MLLEKTSMTDMSERTTSFVRFFCQDFHVTIHGNTNFVTPEFLHSVHFVIVRTWAQLMLLLLANASSLMGFPGNFGINSQTAQQGIDNGNADRMHRKH